MNRLLKIICSLQNKMYKLYLINSRKASFVCQLVLHFYENQVKLSSTYGNTTAGFSSYSCYHAVSHIVTPLSLASCLCITCLLLNIINLVWFDTQNLKHQYCQWQVIASLLETFKFLSAVFNCDTEGFIEVVKFHVINI